MIIGQWKFGIVFDNIQVQTKFSRIMKIFSPNVLIGILFLSIIASSCEYTAEVYSTNENMYYSVIEGYDDGEFDIIHGDIVFRKVDYVFNTLTFDVVNGGNLDAYDIEIDVVITTDKSGEFYESYYIEWLPEGDSERITVDITLKDEYFEDYTIDVYWYE